MNVNPEMDSQTAYPQLLPPDYLCEVWPAFSPSLLPIPPTLLLPFLFPFNNLY